MVSYSGIAKCDNAKLCPVCAVSIQADRREKIVGVLANATAQNCRVAMGTFTLRHRRGQSLSWLMDTLSSTYAKVFRNKKIKRKLAEMGLDAECGGYIRVIESTYSEANGWHPHIHYLLIFEFPNPDDLDDKALDRSFAETLKSLATELRKAWSYNVSHKRDQDKKKMVPSGLAVPWEKFQDLKVAVTPQGAAEYVMKEDRSAESAAWEMASSSTKKGRRKTSRTIWQILFDMLAESRTARQKAADRALWAEWEQATCLTKNRRMFQPSVGLEDRYGSMETKGSEEAEGVKEGTPIIGSVASWKHLMSSPDEHGHLRCDLKKAGVLLSVFRWEVQLTGEIEAGIAAVRTWCTKNGVAWMEAHDTRAEESRRQHEHDNFMPEGSLGQSWEQHKEIQRGIEAVEAFANLPWEEQQVILYENAQAEAAATAIDQMQKDADVEERRLRLTIAYAKGWIADDGTGALRNRGHIVVGDVSQLYPHNGPDVGLMRQFHEVNDGWRQWDESTWPEVLSAGPET